MNTDICDASVSITDPTALAEWNATIRAFMAHGSQTPLHLGKVLELEPGFAMGHAAKGLFSLMLGRSELTVVARDALAVAERALAQGQAPLRERLWCRALSAWLAGRPSGAIALMEEALMDNPRDTLSAKMSHAIRFVLGDNHGMRRSIERVLNAHGDDHPLRGFVHGCHAFTLEETGEYAAAEAAGLRGLQSAPDDAWGLHAVAHVYDMTHQPERGIALIEENAGSWLHCNNFRYHVWWHKALLHLDRGELEKVVQLYDTEIRHDRTDDYRDFSNASSLLMRLELEGVHVGDRWQELADLAEKRASDACAAFADLHYMMALTRENRTEATQTMLERFHRNAADPETETLRIIAEPGLTAAEGLAAYGEGQYGAAFRNLVQAQPRMQTVGGSHAQRDVFERITIDAGMRAGYLSETEALIRKRTALRGGIEDAFAAARMEQLSVAMRRASA
ncbi:tetratricopeptide repeat protein [Paracoccus sp. 1_MG-2023]|uniref:tetratricopeptide repeat protein n=1 Tax=unclassified Paracoccus (in: a-proteobacteria) TaxID=2688777 RepID=UPI001C0810B1|nr:MULTISPECIES: tetratricopeptide repeat protein [unclassified Paracoccus (in: a-proteobacteria)]MBU2957659.1 tetratricopeptide repeat protein [Paracoccus sp. C2R09]MDO6667493.1 tetratricopeptide repeat protein [Paracoccus sp. 1_MG-2023]